MTRRLPDCHASDDPGPRAIYTCVSWISGADVVEEIESIHTELGCEVLPNLSILQYGDVGIKKRWTIVAVASNCTELIEEGPGEYSRDRSVRSHRRARHEKRPRVGCRVERSEMYRHISTRLVGLTGAVRYVGSALAIARSVGETARPGEVPIELPSADEIVSPRWDAVEELLVMPKGQTIIPVELELLCPQVIISSVQNALVNVGVIVVSVVERRLPRVPRCKLQTLGEVLVQGRLQGVVMSIESVVVVRQVLGPAELGIILPEVVRVAGLGLRRR